MSWLNIFGLNSCFLLKLCKVCFSRPLVDSRLWRPRCGHFHFSFFSLLPISQLMLWPNLGAPILQVQGKSYRFSLAFPDFYFLICGLFLYVAFHSLNWYRYLETSQLYEWNIKWSKKGWLNIPVYSFFR